MTKLDEITKYLEILNEIPEDCSDVEESQECECGATFLDEQFCFNDSDDESDLFTNNEDEPSQNENTRIISESEYKNLLNERIKLDEERIFSFEDDLHELSDQEELGLDGTVWRKIEEGGVPGRFSKKNDFNEIFGPTASAKKNIMKGNVSSAFFCIIDDQIISYIQKCTEVEASQVLGKKYTISVEKLKAFFGILYARGAYEGNNLNLHYLWDNKWGPSFFKNTMSRQNFTEILRFIRFDLKNQREQLLKLDKFALISEVWNRFIENSQACYKPGPYITIDEQLFPTKARCRFIQYMPNKPFKFGIKFWLASDVASKYVLNGFPYLGKDENRNKNVNLSEYVVMKLAEPFTMKGRTITTDNFFTSVSLALKLKEKKTFLVGTIRANKRELPKNVKSIKDNMPRFSSLFYRSRECFLTVYKSKPNKKVLVLSSKHQSSKVDKTYKKLPETILFYNKTKFGVDVTDQMAHKYTVKSASRRWPLQVFFNILDLAGINSWILYKETTGEKISRKDYLFRLAKELASDFQILRQNKDDSKQKTDDSNLSIKSETKPDRMRCHIGYCNNNKASNVCHNCKKSVCGKCTARKMVFCKNCD